MDEKIVDRLIAIGFNVETVQVCRVLNFGMPTINVFHSIKTFRFRFGTWEVCPVFFQLLDGLLTFRRSVKYSVGNIDYYIMK